MTKTKNLEALLVSFDKALMENDKAKMKKSIVGINTIVFSDDISLDELYPYEERISIIYNKGLSAKLFDEFEYFDHLINLYKLLLNPSIDTKRQHNLWIAYMFNVVQIGLVNMYDAKNQKKADKIIDKINQTTFDYIKSVIDEYKETPVVYAHRLIHLYNIVNRVPDRPLFCTLSVELQKIVVENLFLQPYIRLNVGVMVGDEVILNEYDNVEEVD